MREFFMYFNRDERNGLSRGACLKYTFADVKEDVSKSFQHNDCEKFLFRYEPSDDEPYQQLEGVPKNPHPIVYMDKGLPYTPEESRRGTRYVATQCWHVAEKKDLPFILNRES